MVMKDAGRYICVPDPMTGGHGDTFDSGKLANYGLFSAGGAILTTEGIRYGSAAIPGRQFRPRLMGNARPQKTDILTLEEIGR
jgi:hypothetical protein